MGTETDDKGKAETTDRRRHKRFTDEEFDAYYHAWSRWLAQRVGAAVLRGVGWFILAWILVAITDLASGGKISPGAALKLLMGTL